MEIKGTGFAYNVTTDAHSNSDWGAEIGQGSKKLMDVDGISEILNGMLYYKVDDINRIKAVLGKGNRTLKPLGDYAPDTSIVVAAVFPKVYVNGKHLDGQEFIMFVTKDERVNNNKGLPNVHYQRRSLKFSDKATFDDQPLNFECIKAISKSLGCTTDGSWIVTDIDFIDDYLSLTALVVDKSSPYDFSSKEERSSFLKRARLSNTIGSLSPSQYTGDVSPIILYGPPGTGKTHSLQMDYVHKFDDGLVEFTTFHQSFSYEEFVEGLKPILDDDSENVKYTIEKGVFYNVCEKASQLAGYNSLKECINDDAIARQERFKQAVKDKKLALLCIDEINRGNVASIFGDLISLIEPSKRLGAEQELTLTLPYSKQRFGVPANLVIVGTMNTADRSIQLLDSALRRRFRFQECPPEYHVIQNDTARGVLKAINSRIRAILNKDNQIGHSYLMHATTNVEILTALVDKIIPLLEEYFYNNVDKIRFVLNDTGKPEPHYYVEDNDAKKAARKYSDVDINTEEVDFYELNPDLKSVISRNNEDEAKRYLDIIIGE